MLDECLNQAESLDDDKVDIYRDRDYVFNIQMLLQMQRGRRDLGIDDSLQISAYKNNRFDLDGVAEQCLATVSCPGTPAGRRTLQKEVLNR